MGSFLKHQKPWKRLFMCDTVLLVLGISKEDFAGFFNPCKPCRVVFGICCNRMFYKFPGEFHYCGSWSNFEHKLFTMVNLEV